MLSLLKNIRIFSSLVSFLILSFLRNLYSYFVSNSFVSILILFGLINFIISSNSRFLYFSEFSLLIAFISALLSFNISPVSILKSFIKVGISLNCFFIILSFT